MLETNAGATRSSWSAERSALVADALRAGNPSLRVRLRVYGESMLPSLWPGDTVEITPCTPEDLQTGEIILALREGRLFLHRLIAPSTQRGFLLRGDSVPAPDPLFPPEALVGRLVGRNLSLGTTRFATSWFAASRIGTVWSRAWGMLFCHWGFARRVALRLHSWKSSAREFRNPAGSADLSSSELGVS
jgi:hypothetical protein